MVAQVRIRRTSGLGRMEPANLPLRGYEQHWLALKSDGAGTELLRIRADLSDQSRQFLSILVLGRSSLPGRAGVRGVDRRHNEDSR